MPAGEPLDGKILYARQKALRASGAIAPGPAVVCANLILPENLGGALRVAEAAGCSEVRFVFDRKPKQWARALKVARESHKHVPWLHQSVDDFLAQSASLQPLIAIELTTAARDLFDAPLPRQCAFVVGNERYGVPARVLEACASAVRVPMFGVGGAMNVTHALAIVLWEWRRRHAAPGTRPDQAREEPPPEL